MASPFMSPAAIEALQRDLTFANRVRRNFDRGALLAKNSICPGHQKMRSLRGGLVDGPLGRAPAFVKSVLISAEASIMSIRASSPAGGGRWRSAARVCTESDGLMYICAEASSSP